MNDYQARRAAKAARFQQFADNAAKRAGAAFEATDRIADQIPLGQPILVGHHSERHARRDVERIHSGMRRGIEEQRKADYWARRAAAVENDTSISKWDPDALPLLTAKIAALEEQRNEQKAFNAAYRKGTAPAKVTARMDDLKRTCPWITQPFDTAHLSANIRRYKQRVGEVERFQAANEIAASECPGD